MTKEQRFLEIQELSERLLEEYHDSECSFESIIKKAIEWADEHPKNPWKRPDELHDVGQCVFIVRIKNGDTSGCLGYFKGKDSEGYRFANDEHEFVVHEDDFITWKEEPKTYCLPEEGGNA